MTASLLPLLLFRPEPGASETARRAAAIGFNTISSPLFDIAPRTWQAPPIEQCDALLLTSANAPREAGPDLAGLASLPCIAVGNATAKAAREQGLPVVWTGETDAKAALEEAASRGYRRLLWLCGEQHVPLIHPKIAITVIPVYTAHARALTAAAREALNHPAILLLHSQRAAWAVADHVRHTGMRAHLGVIAISAAVAAVAGKGWAWTHWPPHPDDNDMLELANALCHKRRP